MKPADMQATIPPRAIERVVITLRLAAPFLRSLLLAYAINASVMASFHVIATYVVTTQNMMNTLPCLMPKSMSKMIEIITTLEFIIKYIFLLDPNIVTLSEKIAKKILAIHGNAIIPSKKVISPGYKPSLSLNT